MKQSLVVRPTEDIDVLALVVDGAAAPPKPFPEGLSRAIGRVARDIGAPNDWLNHGPGVLQSDPDGLPEGIVGRSRAVRYGNKLTVHFIGRRDQIFLKLFALVDAPAPASKHQRDLLALHSTDDEALAAARWCAARERDPSALLGELKRILEALGYTDAAGRLP